jgi:phenylpropionate dioxygenase-like ring-hydroxylating dioxygenase large terminal subunit
MPINTKPKDHVPGFLTDLVTRQPRGHSLLQAFYTDEAVYRRDIERIFMRHWLCAGHESMASNVGDYFLCEVGEESVIIVRGADRKLRALVNVCRHRGSRVCLKKQGNAKVLVCPYHAWAYNLNGSLRSARHMPDGFSAGDYGLKQIHIEVVEGLVLISFADEPLGLDDARRGIEGAYGPYGWATANVAHRELYTIAANWKLAVENYLECYHCGPSHKEYSKTHALEQPPEKIAALNASMEERTRRLGITIPHCENWSPSRDGQEAIRSFRYALYDGVKTGSEDGSPLAPPMGAFTGFDGGLTSTHFGPASFFVGYTDHGVIYRFIPRSLAITEMEIIWLVRGDAKEGADYDLAKLTWLWKVTSDADKKITEDNQLGVNSRFYAPGPYAPMEANATHYIHWYLEELSDQQDAKKSKSRNPSRAEA